MNHKQIAQMEGVTAHYIRDRVTDLLKMFGASTIVNLVAMLIASDVLRLNDLYQEIDVFVREHSRSKYGRSTYRLRDVREKDVETV
jgi:hypothetical protein